jgi:hypothetical protein
VFIVEQGKARQQVIALGTHQGKLWEITEGLKGNETLASSNLNQLATGTSVRIGGGEGEEGAAPGGEGGGRRGRGRGQGAQGRGEGGSR